MKSTLRDLAETVILTLVIFLLVRAVVQNFKVEGRSMEPTLQNNQYLLVNKIVYWHLDGAILSALFPGMVDESLARDGAVYPFGEPRRGDIVVFRFPRDPSRDFIKRIVAVPGDTVEIRAGRVFVNGQFIHETYVNQNGNYSWGPERISSGAYFVLGDNRNNSSDSHVWGPVPRDNIIGKAWLSYWPFDQFGVLSDSAFAFAALP